MLSLRYEGELSDVFVTAKTLFLSNVCVSFAAIMSVEECEV